MTEGSPSKKIKLSNDKREDDNIKWTSELVCYINGKRSVSTNVEPHQTLLEFLRSRGLTGTKLGCGEGGCGACTVMVSSRDQHTGKVVHRNVNACLAPVCSIDSCAVTTIEGIGSTKDPHPAQERIAKFHGSQCGFCTPGIVMSLYAALRNNPTPSLNDLESTFDGNLCRCTGYRPILDAAKTFASDKAACPGKKPGAIGLKAEAPEDTDVLSDSAAKALDAEPLTRPDWQKTEIEFPPELQRRAPNNLKVEGRRVTWYRPVSLRALLELKAKFPQAKIVAGNTEIGIETKFQHKNYPIQVATSAIHNLQQLRVEENKSSSESHLVIGGAVTLAQLEHFVEELIKSRPAHTTRGCKAILDMLRWFASHQIRNVAVLAGNLVTASPIADLNPVLMALDAVITLGSCDRGQREVPVRQFFKGYRRVDMKPDEVLLHVTVPMTSELEFVYAYKQARRRDDDISIVNACVRVVLAESPKGLSIQDITTGFGGVAPVTKAAKELEKAMRGSLWDEKTTDRAVSAVAKDFIMPANVPGGMPAYRQALVASFLYKFVVAVSDDLHQAGHKAVPKLDKRDLTARTSFLSETRPVTHGTQLFNVPKGGMHHSKAKNGADHQEDTNDTRAPVGQPVPHLAALMQCTGEAKYVDDLPDPANALHTALVLSSQPHARIVSLDLTAAEASEGVAKVFSAKDLTPEQNATGVVYMDEQLFRADTVTSTGQVIAAVVAESRELADAAALLVKVEYDELKPVVISIDDAIECKSYFEQCHNTITNGDVDAALKSADLIKVEGEMRVGGQEHFYLECFSALAIPGEQDEIELISSTQGVSKAQKAAAHACGIPANRVVVKMKRMGGAFGGKETRTNFINSVVAVAAQHLKRPVRINLDRDVDMWTTGTRHAFLGKYIAGCTKDGKIVALDVKLFNNAGYSTDLSGPVMDRGLFHVCNAYKIPHVRAQGHLCYTNTVTNTAFRGFGAPQGMLVGEAVVSHVAAALKMAPEMVREKNLYQPGDRTHFGQLIERNPLPRLWSTLRQSSSFDIRKTANEEFNRVNRWKKRGIAMIPTIFGISFTATFFNQAGALVHIYLDGTVLISHGGTEMGQGLHTKMIQVASRALGIPMSEVHISETSTDKVPNASPTAASASSDMYGMAVLEACEVLKARLAPYQEGGKSFSEAVTAAYFARVSLSAQGFYKMKVSGYDFNKKLSVGECNSVRGQPFAYFTFGAACSEVEIDVLTGDMRVLRADITMDVGNSLNPTIDIGQIEGAFTQGLGWSTLEELVWGCDEVSWLKPGVCNTRGPGKYKIPSFNDVPIDFRVTLLRDSANQRAIHSSRAVGEPPLFLGSSALLATRMAIKSARAEHGHDDTYFEVQCPLTPERIRLACGDPIAKRVGPNASDLGGGTTDSVGGWRVGGFT